MQHREPKENSKFITIEDKEIKEDDKVPLSLEDEVREAIRSLKLNKAIGSDSITNASK